MVDSVWPDLAKICHFGKILWLFFEVLFCVGKILNPSWQLLWYWTNFHCCKWPNMEKIIKPTGHTDGGLLLYQPSTLTIPVWILSMTRFFCKNLKEKVYKSQWFGRKTVQLILPKYISMVIAQTSLRHFVFQMSLNSVK